jgi:hypothetical protein
VAAVLTTTACNAGIRKSVQWLNRLRKIRDRQMDVSAGVAGAKSPVSFACFAARLKSCPDTKPSSHADDEALTPQQSKPFADAFRSCVITRFGLRGTNLRAAEKLCCVSGHDFSRAINGWKYSWALAPASPAPCRLFPQTRSASKEAQFSWRHYGICFRCSSRVDDKGGPQPHDSLEYPGLKSGFMFVQLFGCA